MENRKALLVYCGGLDHTFVDALASDRINQSRRTLSTRLGFCHPSQFGRFPAYLQHFQVVRKLENTGENVAPSLENHNSRIHLASLAHATSVFQ